MASSCPPAWRYNATTSGARETSNSETKPRVYCGVLVLFGARLVPTTKLQQHRTFDIQNWRNVESESQVANGTPTEACRGMGIAPNYFHIEARFLPHERVHKTERQTLSLQLTHYAWRHPAKDQHKQTAPFLTPPIQH